MLAEMLVRSGHMLVRGYPPEGRDYWSQRFWNRDEAESRPILGDDFRAQKEQIADLLQRYSEGTPRILEFACGTGEITAMAAKVTAAREIVATDISEQALDIAARRVDFPGVRFVQGDFWADNDLGTADLVVCVDAIHHLGDVRAVLRRLASHVAPHGVFIGNLWTLDNFHEYQRQRYGNFRHLGRASLFFATALTMRMSAGRIRTASYRTQLLPSHDLDPLLREVFSEILEVHSTRHFACFACRP